MSVIVISTFKAVTGSCGCRGGCSGSGGWDPSKFAGGCGGCGSLYGLRGVFSTFFVLYLHDLPSFSSTSSISSL